MSWDAPSNPFASRAIRPGAREYLFLDEATPDVIVARLRDAGWFGQIVGPHGTGKSTLVRSLLEPLRLAGRDCVTATLSQGQRWWGPSRADRRGWNARTLLVVDGYEQLNAWSRWRLRRAVRKASAGLLVTTHEDLGLPTLYQTTVPLALARRIVADMQAGGAALIGPDDVAERLDARQGNFREALFDFYDLYELRRTRAGS